MPTIINRKQAIASGLPSYFTGLPCKIGGHIAERQTSSGGCLECRRLKLLVYRAVNTSEVRARDAAWRKANPEKIKKYYVKHGASNNPKRRAQIRAWRRKNPDKVRAWKQGEGMSVEKRREVNAAYAKSHPEKFRANAARRRALRKRQTCACCSLANIQAIYAICPKGHEVDHVVALALGGLHCVFNLQILTKAAHKEKTKRDMADIVATRRRKLSCPR